MQNHHKDHKNHKHNKHSRKHKHHQYVFPVHGEFNRYKKGLRWMPVLFISLTLIISVLLYNYYSMGIPGILIAVIISIMILREIATIVFATRLNRRILKPMEELTQAFEALSKGDYGYEIDNVYKHQMKHVVASFNEMSQRLEESQTLKEKYDKNQKELIAGISHDLKSPMTSIIGYLEGIEEGVADTPEKLATYLDVIYSNATYSNKLIDDLFLISKLDLNELKFNKTQVNAKAFFEDVLLEKQLKYDQSRFEYTIDLATSISMMIDPQLILRVLNNIYDNAEKYNDKDQCQITTQVSGKDYITIEIQDNGSGIDEQQLDVIFSKFYRIDPSRNKEIGGSGLGLSIAKEIIEKHGGRINASNTEAGLKITIVLEGLADE